MYLAGQFPSANLESKTIQLELSGGGAYGIYECGALEVLIPFWQARGYKIDAVTGISAGAINAVLLSSALNTNKDSTEVMRGFWNEIAAKGDQFLAPMLDVYSLTECFNIFARAEDRFPNIPRRWLQFAGKSDLPLTQLKQLITDHIGPEGWEALRTGPTQTFVGAQHVFKDGHREPVIFTGDKLTPDTVISSAALRDFSPYMIDGEIYEDGGYDKIGFFLKDHKTDVLFAIGLRPLRNPSELEDHRGVKTGQLHHDLAKYFIDPERKCHIDFICMDYPANWNETSAMNNTSKHLNALRAMGKVDALKWIAEHGVTFGQTSSFSPSPILLDLIKPKFETLEAA